MVRETHAVLEHASGQPIKLILVLELGAASIAPQVHVFQRATSCDKHGLVITNELVHDMLYKIVRVTEVCGHVDV